MRDRVSGALLVWLAAAMSLAAGSGRADEIGQIRVATQFGLAYLPLVVMEHDHLWEKAAEARGVRVKVEYARLGGGATLNDALISDSVDLVAGGIPPMLALWDRTRDNFEVRGLSALNASPIFLLSNRANVKSVRDFDDTDRIAVPAIRSGSIQAILLSMAAENAFGRGARDRFDTIEVAMQHPDAFAALGSGGAAVTGYFSSPPFQERALKNPKIHKVTDSFEIQGGPATFSVTYAKAKFVRDNPKLIEAYFAAIRDAISQIRADPDRVLKDYAETTGDKTESALLREILKDPNFSFDLAPKGSIGIADFMARAGLIKRTPQSWKDYFFPALYDLQGS